MKKIIMGFLLGALLMSGYTYVVYSLGSSSGASEVMAKWAAENQKRDEASAELVAKNAQLSKENTRLSAEISDNLENANVKYQQGLAAGQREFAVRLQQSNDRAGIYREQAEGGAAERERLASHAAELDRSLEEGRAVVRELWQTVGLRDEQIRQLSKQIIADRALLD